MEAGKSDERGRIHETNVGAKTIVDHSPSGLKENGIVRTEVRDELNERSIGMVQDEATVLATNQR